MASESTHTRIYSLLVRLSSESESAVRVPLLGHLCVARLLLQLEECIVCGRAVIEHVSADAGRAAAEPLALSTYSSYLVHGHRSGLQMEYGIHASRDLRWNTGIRIHHVGLGFSWDFLLLIINYDT